MVENGIQAHAKGSACVCVSPRCMRAQGKKVRHVSVRGQPKRECVKGEGEGESALGKKEETYRQTEEKKKLEASTAHAASA